MNKHAVQTPFCAKNSTMPQRSAAHRLRASSIAPLVFAGIAWMAVSSAAYASEPGMGTLGSSAKTASRMIKIDQSTHYVNVNAGDTVGFVAGGKNFDWHFNVASQVYMLDLKQIAPKNTLEHPVKVYVAPSLISIF